MSRLSVIMVVQLGLLCLRDAMLLWRKLSLRGATLADRVDTGGRVDRGDRAGTSAIVTPLWSYSYPGDTEARDIEEGFSSTS